MHVLILGGTGEARELATRLAVAGVRVTSSLAGRVAAPRLPAGEVRVGGFGGPAGLAAWLREHGADAVVDATHPFAARISASAREACAVAGVPLLRLERPGWAERPGDVWERAADLAGAAEAVRRRGAPRVLLTLGSSGPQAFAELAEPWFLIRSVDAPPPPLPPRHELRLERGPFTVDGERDLLREHRIDLVVSRDSGGAMTAAKLDAARELGLPVVLVRRPPEPAGGEVVDSVEQAARWVLDGRSTTLSIG